MPPVNYQQDAIEAVWDVVEANALIISEFETKFMRQQFNVDVDLVHEKAPFLAGWPTIPNSITWTAQADRGELEMEWLGAVVTNNTGDSSRVTDLFVNFTQSLRDDHRMGGTSVLRADGRVLSFSFSTPGYLWWRDTSTAPGVYMFGWGLRLLLQNPNA